MEFYRILVNNFIYFVFVGLVLVTDAMSAMGLKEGTYCIGESVVEVTDNRAVVAGTDTLSGSIATMDNCIRFLLKSTGIRMFSFCILIYLNH